MSGGFQDAYTYFARGGVCSNAQTGNVVLSNHIMSGEWMIALKYLLPLIAFASGIFIAKLCILALNMHKDALETGYTCIRNSDSILCRTHSSSLRYLATILVSFSCALQVQTFKKVSGYSYASTMCIEYS